MKNINAPYYPEYFETIKPFFLDKDLKNYTVSLYGSFNNCAWNGGRVNDNFIITLENFQKINKLGISIMLTFTNYIIDITDPVGLELLEWLKESQEVSGVKNTIILCNEEFRIFLEKNYNFNLKFSIIGHKNLTKEKVNDQIGQQDILEYYKDLESKYDVVVAQSELVLLPWFYNNINISQYEVIMNIVAICNYCPIYEEHYTIIADINRSLASNKFSNFNKKHVSINNQCILSCEVADTQREGQCFDSWSDGLEIYNLYDHLKFEGRGDTAAVFETREYFSEYLPLLKYVYGKDKNSPMYQQTIDTMKSYRKVKK